jgi:CheY-like chemotaxis protein
LARTVLLADDSVTAQNMGRRILMDAGYEVVTVNNGSAALKKIHESRPDLIVLDVYMPGYGGLEVCQRLKESADTARIPVLLSVGKMEPFKAEEARRVRADGHIVKPFEASELLAALTKLEDRIVPQAESSGGRQGKSDKKSRFWQAEDPLASAAEVPTERIAYLSEVKKRQSHNDASSEAAEAQVDRESSREEAAAVTPAASTGQSAAESAAAMPSSPAVASSTKTEEFAVRESDIPAQSAGHDEPPPVELQVAEPMAEPPAPVEAPAAEAIASTESLPEESVPEVTAEPPALTATPAIAVGSSPASTARWVAENVALSVEEASIALETEMQQANAVSPVAATETEIPAQDQTTSSDQAVAQTAPPEAESENPSGAAFAAAASAEASGRQSAVSNQPTTGVAGDPGSVPEAEPPVPSEAAAAWENWQQIREAVMSPQKAAAIAESVAQIAPASALVQEPNPNQDPAPSEATSAAPAQEDNSINDIVDSVLADLKPRLMAEIAKKLAAKK